MADEEKSSSVQCTENTFAEEPVLSTSIANGTAIDNSGTGTSKDSGTTTTTTTTSPIRTSLPPFSREQVMEELQEQIISSIENAESSPKATSQSEDSIKQVDEFTKDDTKPSEPQIANAPVRKDVVIERDPASFPAPPLTPFAPNEIKTKDPKGEAKTVSTPAEPSPQTKERELEKSMVKESRIHEGVDEETKDNASPEVVVVCEPRFAHFLESTIREVLVRNVSMEEVVQKIHEGSSLWKVRGINKWFHRHYKVDMDNMSLVGESKKWWSPGAGTGGEGSENAVPLVEITEVREGWKTDTFNKVSSHHEKSKEKAAATDEPILEENKCFSIIHGPGGREALDLVASSEEERDAWVTGLRHLIQSIKSLYEEKQYDVWLRDKFKEADKDGNGSLNFDEICTLLKNINIQMDKSNAKKLFNQANTNKQKRDGQQVLEVNEFVAFYHALLKMPEVEKLFKKYASDKSQLMSVEQLCAFLQSCQGMPNCDETEAAKMINKFEGSNLKDEGYMTQDGFYHMLQSEEFDIYNCDHQSKIHQDMNRPLSHYYISSSHNTYLTGHQLAGESSVEGYISALKRGCRLLELDVWDGDDGEPIIYHGHTLTTKITLADVLKDGIKAYAFEASPYPVILSIENHLSIEQQRVMVKLMQDILGDLLATDPVPDDITVLPSPEALKNKIIVRGKKPKGTEIEDDDEDDEEDQDKIDYIDSDDGASQSKKKPHKPLAPELTEVVNVCEGKKFVSFQDAFKNYKCVHTPSIGETKAKGLFESSPDDFVKFTERNVTKVYPLGTRADSSNLKPYPFWSVGCQIVALNMQTEDKANFYNDALFRSNGNCGYVLKPDILLNQQPYHPSELSDRYTKIVRITILSGQHLPNSLKKGDIVDPYVQLKVRGHPLDKQKQRTKVIKNNGFNPVWNETLELSIKVPQVSLIYFSLRDESSYARDPVLGLCCIPFTSLATGYRYVHFNDFAGKSLAPSALFVHVSINDN